MASKDIRDIYVSSGVNEKMEPFCTISINNGDMLGQLSPEEMRNMALQWLTVAEAAESDSIVMRVLTEDVGLDLQTASAVLVSLRDKRA